jgi:hypothetical protein
MQHLVITLALSLAVPTCSRHNAKVAPDEWLMLDTYVPTKSCVETSCNVSFNAESYSSLRSYHISSTGALQRSDFEPMVELSTSENTEEAAAPTVQVGALYGVWQGPAANAMNVVKSLGGEQLSVESVIKSNGSLTMDMIYDQWGNASAINANFYWQVTPSLGYYCIYRKRANESAGAQPDCSNITETLEAQLTWLNTAGVKFLTADATNLCDASTFSDQIQTRPLEVLFEEYYAARARGLSTPQIVAWQRVVTGCSWDFISQILDLYNTASYTDLIWKDPATGKKVFFVPASPDAGFVAQIESNGGKNDILVQEMWALFDTNLYAAGRWSFMSPCTSTPAAGGNAVYTTNAVDTGAGSSACGQYMTTNSSLGSVATVSPSYQLSYGSVPYSAAGKFGTLTLKRQFATIFQTAGQHWNSGDLRASALPDNLYLSSWNEFISQPQPNPFKGSYTFSMGLGAAGAAEAADEQEGADNSTPVLMGRSYLLEERLQGQPKSAKTGDDTPSSSTLSAGPGPYTKLYVDTYGSAISRSIEPTLEDGGVMYETVASCVRVMQLAKAIEGEVFALLSAGNVTRASHLQRTLAASFPGQSLTACAVAGEICCAYDETTEGVAVVYSLASTDGSDSLVTTDKTQLANLTCPGCGYNQVCNAYGGPKLFCVDTSLVSTPQAVRGPFVLHSGGCGAGTSGVPYVDPSVVLPTRTPVYKCRTAAGKHYLSQTPACTAGSVLEVTVGCADTSPSSEMPRALRVCQTGQSFYHTLDYTCSGGDAQIALLGYVH